MLFSNYSTDSNKTITIVLFKIFLIFTIYFNSIVQAHAGGLSSSGWTLQNPIAKGASVAYDGLKNVIINGKNVAKTSTALITPVAKDVSKVLLRGVAGVALSVAVEQLLGKVDWVLDPENNAIKYKVNPDEGNQETQCQRFFLLSEGSKQIKSCSKETACAAMVTYANSLSNGYKYSLTGITGETSGNCNVNMTNITTGKIETGGFPYSSVLNPNYDPTTQEKEKSIPLDTVSSKVISNAESGDSDAKVATTAAAADIVNDAKNDDVKAKPIINQLEANAKTETEAGSNTATGETKPNTDTGGTDLALEFPEFCGWAPTICEAAQSAIEFPKTVKEWWIEGNDYVKDKVRAVTDYFKEEAPEKEETEVEINDIPDETNKVNISIGDNTCPSMPVSIHIPFGTVESDISPTYLCDIAKGMKAFFIALGMYTASLIVGRRT